MNSVRIARAADWKVAAAMDVGDCDGPSWWTWGRVVRELMKAMEK